jgi:chromosome segregation ATPase
MADFSLELDVFANTAKLEAGLKKAEKSVDGTADKIDKMGSDTGGFGKFTVGAAKAAAAFGAIEIAAGTISTIGQSLKGIVASFAGETEKAERAFAGALEAAKQLPFGIGGTIDKVNQLALALAGVEDTLAEIAELEADIRAYEERKARVLSILGTMRDIRMEMERQLKLLSEEDEYKRAILEVELDKERQLEELARKRDEALAAGVAEDIVLENYERARKAIEAAAAKRIELIKKEKQAQEEADRLAEEEARRQERQAELDRQAAEHQKKIMEMEKQAAKEREAAAAAQKKAEEEQLAFVNARLKMEQEIAEARAEAERQAAGATATFATAGGSFTAAASAQVNEAKLLTRISQQSRDFLAQIMMNTAQMAGGLNLA